MYEGVGWGRAVGGSRVARGHMEKAVGGGAGFGGWQGRGGGGAHALRCMCVAECRLGAAGPH